uniref:phosphoethanolamine N-methyltransferase n=1 Tax=Homalodisca liturata TaxID=320908 RepID=A0A1B6H741_9HEMI
MDNAELYSVNNEVQKRDANMILSEFVPQFTWSQDEIVLDIGCGPGDVSTEVLLQYMQKDISLVGVDLSSNMIEYANEKFANDKIRFKTLDIATKDIKKHFPEKYFSKIFSCHCLHWIQDNKQLAQNLFTLLRPGGEFLSVMTPSSQLFLALKLLSGYEQFKQYCEDIDSVIPPLYYSRRPHMDFKKILSAQGLEVITCESRLNPVTYPNLEVMRRAFEAFNPFVKRMPEEVKEQYLDCFESLVKQRIPISESGEIHIKNPIVVTYARRPIPSWSFSGPTSHSCSSIH